MAFNYWQEFVESGIYHIYNRCTSDSLLFRDISDYDNFLEKYCKYFQCYFETYAFCLMPNHFHFLVQIKDLSDQKILNEIKKEKTKVANQFIRENASVDDFLLDQMRRFLSSISLHANNKYGRTGPLFADRFKRIQVISESKLLYLLCYIHHNPIHHNFVIEYSDWEFTSIHSYISKQSNFVNFSFALNWLGDGDTIKGEEVLMEYHRNFQIDFKDPFNID